MSRVILHCDCNSFFASVETVLDPRYKNVPMAVCGSEDDRHGIVLAKNELAKKYNIATAETVFSAKKKCPELVICEPHHEEYIKFSKQVNEIYKRYTDMIEPFGIDESWLDVSASRKLFGSGMEIAESIRQAVKREIGITVSIGVSFNKVFAKLGSDYKKPDAITEISEENFKSIVFPLKVSDLLFVGKRTADILSSIGIKTIGELASADVDFLNYKLGKTGYMLHKYANGLDDSPVLSERDEAKSVGNGLTFKHDLTTLDECRIAVDHLSDQIGRRLKKNGQMASTVSVSIKDPTLRTVQRQKPLEVPTDLSREIAKTAFELIRDEWNEGKPIRTITVTALNLINAEGSAIQISIFDTNSEKDHKREKAVDIIKQKFGNSSITSGAAIGSDIGIKTKNS
jgi:DNA polymerase-4